MPMFSPNYCQTAKNVIEIEISALQPLIHRLDDNFNSACDILFHCKGRVIVMGMGKSGHIARKIAATLASTGTPAFFIHPAEANHGDLGMITKEDVVLALSNSGTTEEIITLLPLLKRFTIPLIILTGNLKSVLAKEADIALNISVEREACPHNLAPTASTTVALVMGDAIAVALLEAKGFTKEDFALSHPGGRLGKRLLIRICDIMHTGDAVPSVNAQALLSQALLEMSRKGFGMTAVLNNKQKLIGIFTDGDLRRSVDKNMDIHNVKVEDVMTPHCVTARPDLLAYEALALLEKHKISAVLVTDEYNKLIGVFHFHDLLKAGVV